jgi:tetratricopeptide (TPR) repeat protein
LVVVPPQADAIPSAAEFLERADRARQRGEHARAARLYRDLQHAHPGSREALVSRVSLARVHLDHLGNPRTALYHFDRYLRAGRDHSLDTEALAGRAEAYRRLGERENELEAWRAMIRQYPDSPAARRGQRRIAELSP